MSAKQDRQGVRTPSDIERKYDLSGKDYTEIKNMATNAQNAADRAASAVDSAVKAASAATQAVEDMTSDVEDIDTRVKALEDADVSLYDKLWENSSPSSEFATQTLNLDTSAYDLIGIVIRYKTSTANAYGLNMVMLREGSTTTFACVCDYVSSANENVPPYRYASVPAARTSIYFGDGYTFKSVADNNYAIPYAIYGFKRTVNIGTGGGGQSSEKESMDYPGCYYRMVNGVQEWINPPMELDVEYKTSERYMGKPVYVKCVSLGKLPNNSSVNVGFNAPADKIVSLDGMAVSATYKMPLSCYPKVIEFYCNTSSGTVGVATNADASSYTGEVTIKYTKTTD